MKQSKIIINLEPFLSKDDALLSNKNSVDFEYLLRYLEIFKDDVISKFSLNFPSCWEAKLNITFILMYQHYLDSNDIRFFNTLYKNKSLIKKLNILYKKNKMYKLIIYIFKTIKAEK